MKLKENILRTCFVIEYIIFERQLHDKENITKIQRYDVFPNNLSSFREICKLFELFEKHH